MLGQLFHSLNINRSSEPSTSSIGDDLHTRNLLFPDLSTSAYPKLDKIDLEYPRDIQILIAQHDALKNRLLYDSKAVSQPLSPFTPTAQKLSQLPNSPPNAHLRANSLILERNPAKPVSRRKDSTSSVYSIDENASTTSLESSPLPDAGDVVSIALGCMFQNAAPTYKGPSTKLHIVPRSSKPSDSAVYSPIHPTIPMPNPTSVPALSVPSPSSSLGRSSMVRRPSGLSKSLLPTMSTIDLNDPSPFPEPINNFSSRRVVLITRTFSIPWTEEDVEKKAAPSAASKPRTVPKSGKLRLRSLMFAVTIIIALPIGHESSASRNSTLSRKAGSAFASQTAYASSPDSDQQRLPNWLSDTMIDTINSMSDVDPKTDLIGRHWEIFARALTTLQYVAQQGILEYLKTSTYKPAYKISAGAFANDLPLAKSVDATAIRVVRGLTINRVRTGPVPWPSWREEALWVSSWANAEKQAQFFPTLLSAFLGTHTDWLHSLAPDWYRHKYREQQRLTPTAETVSIPSRTIVVASNKMAARRLIYLLGAFLPPTYTSKGDISPFRPGTSASIHRDYSQSPPKPVATRQESLLRAMNQRRVNSQSQRSHSQSRIDSDDSFETTLSEYTRPRRSLDIRSIRSKSYLGENDSASQKSKITIATALPSPTSIRPEFSQTKSRVEPRSRTNSIAASSLQQQPLHQSSTQKATGLPSPTTISPSKETFQKQQRRRRSSGTESWTGRLGNLGKLFDFTNRRFSGSAASSTNEPSQSSDERLGISDPRAMDSPFMMQQMVDDIQSITAKHVEIYPAHHSLHSFQAASPRANSNCTVDESRPVVFASPEIPDLAEFPLPSPESERFAIPSIQSPTETSTIPSDMTLRATMAADGVIDVEIPFLNSPNSPSSSPSVSASVPFLPSQNHHQTSSIGQPSLLTSVDAKNSPNAAGWLDRMHPDFTLLAIRPSSSVQTDIQAALSAEPNPPLSTVSLAAGKCPERWLDVCSALVINTTNWTVTRIHLRRLVRYVRQANTPAAATSVLAASNTTTTAMGQSPSKFPSFSSLTIGVTGGAAFPKGMYGNPYAEPTLAANAPSQTGMAEFTLGEDWQTETVNQPDAVMAALLERIVNGGGGSSDYLTQKPDIFSDGRDDVDAYNDSAIPPSTTATATTASIDIQSGGKEKNEIKQDEKRDIGSMIYSTLENLVANLSRNARGDETEAGEQSVLALGIRSWLEEVEAKNVAIQAATLTAGGFVQSAGEEFTACGVKSGLIEKDDGCNV